MSRHGSASAADRLRAGAAPSFFSHGAASPHDLGSGRLEASPPRDRVEKVLRIDATRAPSNLLARLLVGSYITGHDRVVITARHGLSRARRREIHQMVDRILGMSVVGDRRNLVEVQSFLDPGKYELPRLLHRLVQLVRTELGLCHAALTEKEPPSLRPIEGLEEEIDRLYLLMVRQLLLSSDSPRIARSIDVESHHFQIGDRVVAKVLEVTGDLIAGIAAELDTHRSDLHRLPRGIVRTLALEIERLERLFTETMDAFGRLSALDANRTLNTIKRAFARDTSLGSLIAARVPDRTLAAASHRIAFNLEIATEMLICVNEITINRSVEPETVARLGTRVDRAARRAGRLGVVTYPPIDLLFNNSGRPVVPAA